MGPLSSRVVTSYRLPIVIIGLSEAISRRFRSASACHRQTDRQTDGIGLAKGGIMR